MNFLNSKAAVIEEALRQNAQVEKQLHPVPIQKKNATSREACRKTQNPSSLSKVHDVSFFFLYHFELKFLVCIFRTQFTFSLKL